MQRIKISPRSSWQERVEKSGFVYHTLDGTYWDETKYYKFTLEQIEKIERATNEIWEMYIKAVQYVIDKDLFDKLNFPQKYKNYLISKWEEDVPSIYGRFDFCFDGENLKLLEFNADTPTSLFEASVVQWEWLQDFNKDGDQFNSIHEKLIKHWAYLKNYLYNNKVHFACVKDSVEDYINTEYMRDTAIQAGLDTKFLYIDEIGYDKDKNIFIDVEEEGISNMFKLYPWEWITEDDFGDKIVMENNQTMWVEPIWKGLMSNKGMLAILYELYPNSEWLLPTYFDRPTDMTSYCIKPTISREGANVTLVENNQILDYTYGAYDKRDVIYQGLCKLPKFEEDYALIGSWVIAQEACGIGVRESSGLITNNTSKFVPHLFEN